MATSTVRTRSCPGLWLLLFLIPACATYEPMPLDQTTVAARLATPNMEAIQVQAKEIQHPVLKPIEFDIRNGLSPDEAAILAVIANPKLRATRDQRKLAAARADAVSVDLDVAWQEWQAAQAAKLHVYHLAFFDQQLAVTRQEEEGLKENLDRVKRAAELGYMTRIDLAAA